MKSSMHVFLSPFLSVPLIIAGITEDVTDTRATVTLTYVSGISVTSGFMLVGTVSQGASIVQNVNQAFEMSDTTYEIADNLIRNTSYTYDIRIESGADSSIVIGSATGSFATELTPPPPPEGKLSLAIYSQLRINNNNNILMLLP